MSEPVKVEAEVAKNPNVATAAREKVEVVGVTADPKQVPMTKEAVIFILYVMYKANMFSRNNLREMLKIIDEKHPDNIVEWLVKEAVKA